MHREREILYDPARGARLVVRFGGSVSTDVFRPLDELGRYEDEVLRMLAADYREALQTGRARSLGPGEAYGIPVYWVRIRSEWLSDGVDGRHEWAHDVAVSRASFEPIAIRESRDGREVVGTAERILALESIGADEVALRPPLERSFHGTAYKESRREISLDQANGVLGQRPLWLGGSRFAGLPLSRVGEQTVVEGRALATRVTGADGRPIYRFETPIEWGAEHHGVELFYGALGDDPATSRDELVPSLGEPHVAITESVVPLPSPGPPFGYVPPDGHLLLVSSRLGFMHVQGLHVAIEASTEELLRAAARALVPTG